MTTATLPILAYDQVISGYCQDPAIPARGESNDRGLPAAASSAPAHGRLRRVRLPAAVLAQLRAWFDDTAVTLDHTCTCGYADPSTCAAVAAVHVHGLRRNEAFHDWLITGALAGLFPSDVLQQITPLDAPHSPAVFRLPDAAAPLRRAS